ncbi:MAG: hypothetical protein ACRDLA_18145 [Thermoleophilaceae bacterium]
MPFDGPGEHEARFVELDTDDCGREAARVVDQREAGSGADVEDPAALFQADQAERVAPGRLNTVPTLPCRFAGL